MILEKNPLNSSLNGPRVLESGSECNIAPKSISLFVIFNKQKSNMLFEIQALGGKVIASKSAMTTLNRLTTLLPNAKINVQTITLPKIEPDEDDITLAELKEQLEDNMTLAELQDRLLAEEEEEEKEPAPAPIEWVDEMTFYSRTCGELRNF